MQHMGVPCGMRASLLSILENNESGAHPVMLEELLSCQVPTVNLQV